jgi:hypothetical protein
LIWLLDKGDLSMTLEQLGQWLDHNSISSIPDSFNQILQSIIIASSSFNRRSEHPILSFASRLPSAVSDEDFDCFVREVWSDGEAPLKSAMILWNCWSSYPGNQLSRRDVLTLRSPPINLFLAKLPHRFSDLFLNEFFGMQLSESSENHHFDLICCLKCGKLMLVNMSPITIMSNHSMECKMSLMMMITGPGATSIATLNVRENDVTLLRPLYVTEGGDESVGLSLAMPLVLSNERLRSLMNDALIGSFCV